MRREKAADLGEGTGEGVEPSGAAVGVVVVVVVELVVLVVVEVVAMEGVEVPFAGGAVYSPLGVGPSWE
jgi:hypothetical protein